MGLWSGWVFRLLTVLVITNTAGFGISVALHQPWAGHGHWLAVAAIIAVSAVVCRSEVRLPPDAPRAVVRYWRITQAGLVAFALTTTLRQLADAGFPVMWAAYAVHLAAGISMMVAMFQLPLVARTRSSKATVTLDVGTLIVATGVLVFHFAVLPIVTSGPLDVAKVLSSMVLMAAGMGTVQTAARIALSGVVTMSRRTLAAIGASAVVGGLGSAVALLPALRMPTDVLILLLPYAAFLTALSARFQNLDSALPEAPRARRGYSLMPYLAVAVVCVMLTVTAITRAPDHLIVVGFSVIIVVLVIVRQLFAFRQNDALLNRIGVQEKQFRALAQNSTDMVTIIGADGLVRYCSPSSVRVLGIEPPAMVGTGFFDLVHPDDHAAAASRTAELAVPGRVLTYEVRCRHADGTYRWLEATSMNLFDDPGVNGIVSNVRDITETRTVQAQLSHDATHDALTGLANRTLFAQRVEAAVGSGEPDARFCLVLVDLDDFKTVNDTLGHAVGDALLVHVAERMTAGVRPTDTVGRLGGDEFAILFDGLGQDGIGGVLARISYALLEPAVIEGELLSVKASFGVIEGRPGDDADHLMRRADIAMYEAKDRGEGGHQVYQPGMEARGAERSRLAAELRAAITEGQFVLHYQPEVSLPDGRVVAVEALVRWQHPDRGLLGPGAFVDLAEQTGLIVPLGRAVLRSAAHQAAAWARAGHPIGVSVNASARQLRDVGFAGEVAEALRDSGLTPELLTLEITESTAVGGGATQDTLRDLDALGIRLSLDDFGTGASTLSLLATCPVDEVKLDRSFVPPPGSPAIATAVLQLAHAFGVVAVAEGVETAEQAQQLTELGYTRAQGFHFARPMPGGGVGELLREQLSARR